MLSKAQTILLFISTISLIYVLRDHNTSPGTFLRQKVSRILQTQTQQITDTFCQGTTQENDITDSERDTANGHTASYADSRDGNPLANFIEGPQPASQVKDEYAIPALKSAIVFIVLLAVSLLCCLYFITAWCCRNCSFCPSISICKGPKGGTHQVAYAIVTVILMLGLAASGIAGAVTSSGVKSGGQKVVCSIGVFAQKTLDGSNSDNWAGVNQMVADFQIVLNEFPGMVVNLTGAPSLTATTAASGMAATLATAQTSATLMYTRNSMKTVSPRPDPSIVQTSYTPAYIQNLTNVRNAIQNEMSNKSSIVNQAAMQGDQGITKLRLSSPIFLLILQQANAAAANISTTLNSTHSNITAAGVKIHSGLNGLGAGLMAVFAITVVLGAGAIAAVICTFCSSKYSFSAINLCWFLTSIFVLFGWVLAAILYPTTMLVYEGCDVGNRVLANETFFNLTMNKFVVNNFTTGEPTENGPKVKDFLYTCYYGNGDLIEGLNLTGVFDMFSDVFTSLDNIAPLSTYVGPVPDSIVIPQQQALVTNYLQGLIPDGQETITDLATLNNLTHASTDPCTRVVDTWVLNSTVCPNNAGTVFASSSSASFNVQNPTCIGYDAWGNNNINQRYNTTTFPTLSCGNQGLLPTYSYLQKFVNNFVDARGNVASVFGSVQSSLSSVATSNSLYMTSVKTATAAWNPVWTSTVGTRQALWDDTTGFIQNSNCSYLKQATGDVLDSVCVRFGNSLYTTMTVSIAFSCFGLLGVLSLFCFSMKFFPRREEENEEPLIGDYRVRAELPKRDNLL